MNNASKKWLTVTGCLAICAMLVFFIAGQFNREPVQDVPIPTENQIEKVVVPTPNDNTEKQTTQGPNPENPSTPANNNTPGDNGAISSGTKQTIQPDPVKPQPSQEALKDPTQKPDGTPVDGTPIPEDHNNVTPPPPPASTNSGGLPGFDHVPDGGPNQMIEGTSDGDINKQVGIM